MFYCMAMFGVVYKYVMLFGVEWQYIVLYGSVVLCGNMMGCMAIYCVVWQCCVMW